MASKLLFDLESLDLRRIADRAGIAEKNPHRGHFALIDEVLHMSPDRTRLVARMAVRDDAFWCAGHIPGRPIMPGVLQIEAGAQAASYLYYAKCEVPLFAGFTRIQDAAFRGMVEPGVDLTLLVQEIKFSPKRFVSDLQGVVEGEVVFDARISGMAFPHVGPVERVPLEQTSA